MKHHLKELLHLGASLALLAGPGTAWSSPAAASPEFTLVAGLQVAADTPFDKGLKKLRELVEAKTNGRATLNIFPGGQLGNEPELFQAMKEGTVDIAVVAPGQIAEWVPQISMLEMPFLITAAEQRDRVVEGEPMKKLSALIQKKTGVEVIGVFGGGIRNMFFRQHVAGLDDMKGLRFRVQPSRELTDSYKALGLEPVVTSYNELYNALQQGVAQGAEMEAIYVERAGFPAVAKDFLMTGHVITIRLLTMSEKTLSKLPPDVASGVRDAAVEAARYEREIEAKDDKTSLERMAKMPGVTMTKVDVKPMIEAVRPVWEKYAKDWGMTDLLHEIEGMR